MKSFSLVLIAICSITTSLFGQIESMDLSLHEKKIYSQNGEDGILQKIFETIGTTNKYFVEFGVENGRECNTRHLREILGWTGLMMDGGNENHSINLQKEFITAENIQDLFTKYSVPREFDLLSIDIDFNDFYVWMAIKDYNPRVVVIEYNGTHISADADKVVVYNSTYMWDGVHRGWPTYGGASMAALAKLGTLKGYTLVYADNNAVNCFFIRNDILESFAFADAGDINKLFKSAVHRKYLCTPEPHNQKYLTCEEAIALYFNRI